MSTSEREEALAAAHAEPELSSLGAGERLRRRFGSDLAAWALTQERLRRRAAGSNTWAQQMWFTPEGLEQATRETVARWRARRFAAAGIRRVWDLGCGIGVDAMAFAECGIEVVAVDSDAATVDVATHNLGLVGAAAARLGLAQHAEIPGEDAVFLDPARRTARGRTWRIEDVSPPWEFVLEHLAGPRFVAVKLGPGLPKGLIPREAQACWVSERGDVVEVSLWNRLPPGPRAVVLEGQRAHELDSERLRPLPVRPPARYLIEPDKAVIRAGLVGALEPGRDLWLLEPGVAYIGSDEPVDSPFATCFEVLDCLPLDVAKLRCWVREHAIGALEIKKRAVDVDPALLRRQLRPSGPHAVTLVLSRTTSGAKAFVVRRVRRTGERVPSSACEELP